MPLSPDALMKALIQPVAPQIATAVEAMPEGTVVSFFLENGALRFQLQLAIPASPNGVNPELAHAHTHEDV